jgi:hypothetical protein
MFRTGELVPVTPVEPGYSGLEMKTRNASPLGLWVVLEDEEEPLLPQEILVTLTAMSTNMLRKSLFKPGTPKSVKDRDLDARKRIITERLRRICPVGGACRTRRIQMPRPLVVF